MAGEQVFTSYNGGEAVTPSDTVPFGVPARGIYVGGGAPGDVVAVMLDGQVLTFKAVPVGNVLPITCTRINATNTTATNLVALR